MTLRDSLLALLREANYSPANEFELSRRLGLNKKQRAMLAHEVRLVLKSGDFVRAQNGRIGPRGAGGEKPPSRPVVLVLEYQDMEKRNYITHARKYDK